MDDMEEDLEDMELQEDDDDDEAAVEGNGEPKDKQSS